MQKASSGAAKPLCGRYVVRSSGSLARDSAGDRMTVRSGRSAGAPGVPAAVEGAHSCGIPARCVTAQHGPSTSGGRHAPGPGELDDAGMGLGHAVAADCRSSGGSNSCHRDEADGRAHPYAAPSVRVSPEGHATSTMTAPKEGRSVHARDPLELRSARLCRAQGAEGWSIRSATSVRAGPEREAVLDFHGKLGRALVGAGPRLTGGLLDG